jgi:hypothetical protein
MPYLMSNDAVQLAFFNEPEVDTKILRAVSIRHAVSEKYLREFLALLIAHGIEKETALKQMLEAKSHEALYRDWIKLSSKQKTPGESGVFSL